MAAREETILQLARDRLLAHQVLFKHRHPDRTPYFHRELIELWHSNLPRVMAMAFREAGKSTIAEEAFIIGALFSLFHNAIIVGSTEKRACERLRAVKHELETNGLIQELFGFQGGLAAGVWNEAEVILANGVRIIAVGRGQSLRGTKHLHYRPDFAFLDDIEDKEHVVSPDARAETQRWLLDEFMPCLDKKKARVRMNATPLDRDSLPMRIISWKTWTTRVYPIEYFAGDKDLENGYATGDRVPMWPSRYPLSFIDAMKKDYENAGDIEGYMREYMCVAEDLSTKIFTPSMFTVKPVVRTWQPVWAMYDPARTTKASSATTGWAVWSWVANRLIIWDAGGDFWKPDEIVAHIFKIAGEYQPVEIGVEEDGLNEFILQPLRHEQLRRNMFIPLQAKKAPKGKYTFIAGLQPFFNAKEVTFAKELPTLVNQFLSYPTGRIDAPNALAYAPSMRPGVVVYDGFSPHSVFEQLPVRENTQTYLCVNAAYGHTTAVAVQVIDGCLHVLADWVGEGDPGANLRPILLDAQVAFGVRLDALAPPDHWLGFDVVGLRAAASAIPVKLRRGGLPVLGRTELRGLFNRQVRGLPAARIAAAAHWTLNALAAGYAFPVDKHGKLAGEPQPGVYRTLMEGLEAFTAFMKTGIMEPAANVRYTEGGQPYVSALPSKIPAVDKSNFLSGAVSPPASWPARR